MNIVRFSSVLGLLALSLTACSEDEDSTPSTESAANQPTAGRGGSAGGTATATAGRGGAPATASGGASAEAPDDDIDLEPGDVDDDNTGAENGGESADAGAAPTPSSDAGGGDTGGDTTMSFFVTSRGVPEGANFGGVAGADALCQTLAADVSAELGAKTWRAYLSTTAENARDRIGQGPWFNAAGVLVANNVAQLTDQGPGGSLDQTWAPGDATIALDELGNQVPAGGASGAVVHDILTGTLADGTIATGLTCADWTATTGNVQIGHSNRAGGGADPASWSSAHGAPSGCAPIGTPGANVASGGGRGSVYCFAAD